jgi:3-oxoacyl-[acyl-carrier protein] reductase
MNKPLTGQVAIVTGAGRLRGMGRAAALKFAEQGAQVVVTDITPTDKDRANLEGVARDAEEFGIKALAVTVNVTDVAQVWACVEQTMAVFGRIDILFNNAGVWDPGTGPFLEITPNRWDETWQINVMGMVHFCQAVIPIMTEQGGGCIVNNASLAGLGVIADMAAYSVSKAAVVSLTKAIAAEFAAQSIRCNAVCPGIIDTDIGRQEVKWAARVGEMSLEAAESWLLEPVPMQRWAQPEEVAEVVAFLAGPGASYVTGVAVPVAGGLAAGL